MIWSDQIDRILSNGIFIDPAGIKNWALTKENALIALSELYHIGIPVLGGDVCEFKNDKLTHTYDSWYCDPLPNESQVEFLLRSFQVSKKFIADYNAETYDRIFFALVPSIPDNDT